MLSQALIFGSTCQVILTLLGFQLKKHPLLDTSLYFNFFIDLLTNILWYKKNYLNVYVYSFFNFLLIYSILSISIISNPVHAIARTE